jgi:hypothetical protein
MIPYTVRAGQCLLDVAIQNYGSMEALFVLAKDNGLEVDDDIAAGQLLQIRETLPDTADPDIVAYYQLNGTRVNSGADVMVTVVIADNDGNIITNNDNGDLTI